MTITPVTPDPGRGRRLMEIICRTKIRGPLAGNEIECGGMVLRLNDPPQLDRPRTLETENAYRQIEENTERITKLLREGV